LSAISRCAPFRHVSVLRPPRPRAGQPTPLLALRADLRREGEHDEVGIGGEGQHLVRELEAPDERMLDLLASWTATEEQPVAAETSDLD
jgi:hypothetical protein